MARARTKPNGHLYAATKRHRRSVAYWGEREREAGNDPAVRFHVAVDRVKAAAKRPRRPTREVQQLADSVTQQARLTADRADASQASRDHNERAIRVADGATATLAAALRWLHTSLAQLPDGDRERCYAHYTQQLTDEARRMLT